MLSLYRMTMPASGIIAQAMRCTGCSYRMDYTLNFLFTQVSNRKNKPLVPFPESRKRHSRIVDYAALFYIRMGMQGTGEGYSAPSLTAAANSCWMASKLESIGSTFFCRIFRST